MKRLDRLDKECLRRAIEQAKKGKTILLKCIDCQHRYNHITEEPCCECKPEGKKECANG